MLSLSHYLVIFTAFSAAWKDQAEQGERAIRPSLVGLAALQFQIRHQCNSYFHLHRRKSKQQKQSLAVTGIADNHLQVTFNAAV